ncbi:NEDD8-activating enzyme E1 regulatory subunit, partial [Coemansia guatemalensis]
MRTDSDKAQLYDRQLRLWQKDGQAALERARVLVFGSSTLASESLKNLVLPGIGGFTVVDDATVGEQDARTNFFVRPTDVGQSRAQCIVANLSELNPDVVGQAVVASAVDFMESHAESFDTASVVIACGQPESVVCELSRRCEKANIPILAASSAGFQAEVLTSVSEHT